MLYQPRPRYPAELISAGQRFGNIAEQLENALSSVAPHLTIALPEFRVPDYLKSFVPARVPSASELPSPKFQKRERISYAPSASTLPDPSVVFSSSLCNLRLFDAEESHSSSSDHEDWFSARESTPWYASSFQSDVEIAFDNRVVDLLSTDLLEAIGFDLAEFYDVGGVDSPPSPPPCSDTPSFYYTPQSTFYEDSPQDTFLDLATRTPDDAQAIPTAASTYPIRWKKGDGDLMEFLMAGPQGLKGINKTRHQDASKACEDCLAHFSPDNAAFYRDFHNATSSSRSTSNELDNADLAFGPSASASLKLHWRADGGQGDVISFLLNAEAELASQARHPA